MAILATVYCSDEDICVRASGDFIKLVPRDQDRASGTDGAIPAADPWVLTSAAVDFETAGVAPGNMVALWGPRGSAGATRFGEVNVPGLFAVGAVDGHSVTLRRKGMAAGVGQAPAIADLSGLHFRVPTLFPQIERASYQEINERFAIDSALPWRTPAALYDPRQLRDVTALAVLYALYADQARQADDVFMKKAMCVRKEFDDQLNRMTLRWDAAKSGDLPTSVPFGARISR